MRTAGRPWPECGKYLRGMHISVAVYTSDDFFFLVSLAHTGDETTKLLEREKDREHSEGGSERNRKYHRKECSLKE